MGQYRTYKNGIYGCRYKKYYIEVHGEKRDRTFNILSPDLELVMENVRDFFDCKWEIDKITATDEERKLIHSLYKEPMSELNQKFFALVMKNEKTLDEAEEGAWIEKVRSRRAEGLPE